MKLLVSPLDWGLGHATRDVPVIRKLLNEGHQVVLAGGGASLTLLTREFPELETIHLPSPRIRYSRHLPAWLKIILTSPLMALVSLKEHRALARILEGSDIDQVISDNRYGLWSREVPCIIITHQLRIMMPRFFNWLEVPVTRLIGKAIQRFDHCWIPDYAGENNLSGALSHGFVLPENSSYIGILSRFESGSGAGNSIIGVVSGPEPQRSIFEKILFEQLKDHPQPSLIIGGQPQSESGPLGSGNCRIIPHLSSDRLRQHLMEADYIICRSGYSSVMDLVTLKKRAILVPTPGQTEQEYLAERLQEKGWFVSMAQKNFNLDRAIAAIDDLGSGCHFPLPED